MAAHAHPLATGPSQSVKCSNHPLTPAIFTAPAKHLAHTYCPAPANMS
jgi:hypothetical protein